MATAARVFVKGQLWLAREASYELTRRLVAVQLVKIKAAGLAVSMAFGANRETLHRWSAGCEAAGAVGVCGGGGAGPARSAGAEQADHCGG